MILNERRKKEREEVQIWSSISSFPKGSQIPKCRESIP
jgi:hypothetical protein